MAMTDPIGDMLTRIRNGIMASYDTVDIPSSKLKINIAKVLKSEGFIKNYRIMNEGAREIIRVFLKYDEKGVPVIDGLKRVSKPSRRFYTKADKIPWLQLHRQRDAKAWMKRDKEFQQCLNLIYSYCKQVKFFFH